MRLSIAARLAGYAAMVALGVGCTRLGLHQGGGTPLVARHVTRYSEKPSVVALGDAPAIMVAAAACEPAQALPGKVVSPGPASSPITQVKHAVPAAPPMTSEPPLIQLPAVPELRPVDSLPPIVTPPPLPPQPKDNPAADSNVETLPSITVEAQPESERIAPPRPDQRIPISIDAVLRLAQDQNGEVAVAREKLAEAFGEADVAAKGWIPDLTVGGSFYRHDGGIQDFNGNLIRSHYSSLFGGLEVRGKFNVHEFTYQKLDAARKVWKQRGELSKLTSEKLLDATSTYIDLLAARSGEAVAGELEKKLALLLDDVKKMETIDPIARSEVVRVQGELDAQHLIKRKLREGANAAAAKLIYLLGLDPTSELLIMDKTLAPVELVDVSGPPEKLVSQVLVNGPGIQELEGLLALIDDALARSHSPARYMPVVEMCLLEGGFGAGPGASLRWDNRFDLGLHARWNLTDFLLRKEKLHVNQSRIQQAQLTYHDLRGKLTLALFEAREVSLSSKEQIQLGEQQIRSAEKAYQFSIERVGKAKSPLETLLAIRSLAGAQLAYITAIREYDKAQLRLFILTGEAFHPPRRIT